MRARASKGEGYRHKTRQGKTENRERWSRRSGLASRYTVGDHTEKRGDEAAVAFYPDLFWSLTKLDLQWLLYA